MATRPAAKFGEAEGMLRLHRERGEGQENIRFPQQIFHHVHGQKQPAHYARTTTVSHCSDKWSCTHPQGCQVVFGKWQKFISIDKKLSVS